MSKTSVYFFCLPQGSGKKPAYQYQTICIAQGLKSIGVDVYSNLNYWRTSFGTDEYLFRNDPNIKPEDCDVVVFTCQWRTYGMPYPEIVFSKNRKFRLVLVDTCDSLFPPAFEAEARNFDVILKQKSRGLRYPSNCSVPWAYGIGEHLLQLAGLPVPSNERNNTVLVNFRHRHALRDLANERFISKINSRLESDATFESLALSYDAKQFASDAELIFIQSGGRHHENYINRMRHARACATFGGYFMMGNEKENKPFRHKLANYFVRGRAGGAIANTLSAIGMQQKHTYHIYQWDSWRLWESFACGCVTMHVDFEKYGVELPVQPENWKHYVGVDLNNPKNDVERLLSLSDADLINIANSGNEWAVANYSPKPVAQHFLASVN